MTSEESEEVEALRQEGMHKSLAEAGLSAAERGDAALLQHRTFKNPQRHSR
ncbi:MAG: hypothetical protein R3C68_04065 [Myxococcota bacterium]